MLAANTKTLSYCVSLVYDGIRLLEVDRFTVGGGFVYTYGYLLSVAPGNLRYYWDSMDCCRLPIKTKRD